MTHRRRKRLPEVHEEIKYFNVSASPEESLEDYAERCDDEIEMKTILSPAGGKSSQGLNDSDYEERRRLMRLKVKR